MPVTTPYPAETKETAKALYLQGFTPAVIAVQLGVRRATLSKWRENGKWVQIRDGTVKVMTRKGITAVSRETTTKVRDALHNEASQMVEAMRKEPVKNVQELLTTPERQGRAALLKTVVETVAIIEDWNSSHKTGLILSDALGSELDGRDTVEIESEQVSCGVDTPSNSVPDASANHSIPQSAQPPTDTTLAPPSN